MSILPFLPPQCSTIARPEWQQCDGVDFDWAAEFGSCCDTTEDFAVTAPKWAELDEEDLTWSEKYGSPKVECLGMTTCAATRNDTTPESVPGSE